jgi:hypothetical protein
MKSITFRRAFSGFADKQISEVFKVALLLLALVVPAGAQKPIIQPTPFTDPIFIPAADACGFDVLATPQAGRPNKAKVILFANMRIFTGPVFVTLENLSTGKTINLNVSGPVHVNLSGNTVSILGPSINLLPGLGDPLPYPDLSPLQLIHGQIVYTFDDQENLISVDKVTGTVEDVCKLLQ